MAAFALLAGVIATSEALAAADETVLVSRASGATGMKGNDDSREPSISDDGRFVAFQSLANLDPDDTDSALDVYVRDLEEGTTTLASRAGGAAGAKGDDHSHEPSISADGRFVAFRSHAANLDPDDTDTDVYVRDLVENTTTLASRAGGATGTKGNGHSFAPSISADGRSVAFASIAANLDPGDTDAVVDVYVRDLGESTTTLASRAGGAGGAKGNGDSREQSISADGRFVAFRSFADLDPDDSDSILDVYVRDLVEDATTLVSRADGAAGAKGDDDSYAPSISADGRFVAFSSDAANLDPDDTDATTDVFRRELFAPSAPPPPNQFAFGKLKRNAKAGTAKLAVKVPAPGSVVLRKTKQLRPAAAEATSAGQVRLTIRPRGKAKRALDRATMLRRTVKVKLSAPVTYRPSGGEPRTKAKRVVLVRRG